MKHMNTVGAKRHLPLFILPLALLSGCSMDPADKEFFYRSWTRPAGETAPHPLPPEPQPPPPEQP